MDGRPDDLDPNRGGKFKNTVMVWRYGKSKENQEISYEFKELMNSTLRGEGRRKMEGL